MAAPEIRQTVIGDHNIFTATGDITQITYNLPPAEAEERRVLLQLAGSVGQFWVKGVLESSVHDSAMIELHKEVQSEAVEHPWERVLELPGRPAQSLGAGKTTTELFIETGRSLLVLGAPGGGKTVTLLELARGLIARFESGPSEATPVVLNLSTWQERYRSFAAWLESELTKKYFVPVRRTREWLERSRLILLLDGLDEVRAESRPACVRAINEFMETKGAPGIAVCSRLSEYTVLPERLKFSAAICIQPLTAEEVDTYLENGGSQLNGLHMAIRSDVFLQELAGSPLTLSILTLVYRGLPASEIATQGAEGIEARRAELFQTYVRRMFQRAGKPPDCYPEARTREWLGWLARGMRQHSLSVFLLENLQPSWLGGKGLLWTYCILSRLWLAILWVLTWWMVTLSLSPEVRRMFWEGMVLTFISGSTAGIVAGALAARRLQAPPRTRSRFRQRLELIAEILVYPLALGIVMALCSGPFLDGLEQFLLNIKPGTVHGWELGLRTGVYYGLIFGLLFTLRSAQRTASRDISLSGRLHLSLAAARKGAKRGALIGSLIGVLLTIVFVALQWGDFAKNKLWMTLIVVAAACAIIAVILGLLLGFIGALFSMLVPSDLPAKARPGQGLIWSAQSALLAGAVVTLLYSMLSTTMMAVTGSPHPFRLGIIAGFAMGIAAAIWYGGLDAIEHLTLRLLLRWRGFIPRRYADFLDYATRLIFLQKVGSGYIFIHRQLLDYFASKSTPIKPK